MNNEEICKYLHKDLCTNVHISINHNSLNLETT